MSQSPIWQNTRDYMAIKAGEGYQFTAESYAEAILFSTWFTLVKDRASLSAFEYLNNSLPTVSRTKELIELPPQSFYSETIKIAEAFLDGYVQPDQLQQAIHTSKTVADNLMPIIQKISEGKGHYRVNSTGTGMPQCLTDAFYPLQLFKLILQHTSTRGLTTIDPVQKGLISALISDEATGLQRIRRSEDRSL